MSENMVYQPQAYQRLDGLNDELHVIRRFLEKPTFPVVPETLDLLRMAVAYTHDRLMGLAAEMRQDHQREQAKADCELRRGYEGP